jgi:hypothetical protein
MKYLRDAQYYEDLYDLITIRRCLDQVEMYREVYAKMDKEPKAKEFTEKDKVKTFNYMLGMTLLSAKAERYRNRQASIEEWFERDRAKQDRYDNTPEPSGVRCLECDGAMKSTMKHLEDYTDQPLRLLFFFECAKCKKRRGIYENGEEKASKPDLCAKCGGTLNRKSEDKDDVLTITTTCSNCSFTETDVDDFKAWRKEREQREREDKDLLEKYRGEYCFSEKEGKEHVELVDAMKFASEVYKHELQKYDDTARDVAAELKKLDISELEALLAKPLEDARYTKLDLEKPEIAQHVTVPFTVQDADSSRKGDRSTRPLEELLKPLLESTNWRLMDGLAYRLGYVSGRLRGYEQEEDLIRISRKVKGAAPPKLTPLDREKLRKFGYHNMVQMARLNAEFEGKNQQRLRRLKKEPEGFWLEAGNSPYSCQICGQSKYGSEMWWDEHGQRCDDCRRNMLEGVIPKDLPTKHGQTVWFSNHDAEYYHGVRTPTRKKLVREGLLHGRDLRKEDGNAYATIYFYTENKGFLEEHPRKESTVIVTTTEDGKTSMSVSPPDWGGGKKRGGSAPKKVFNEKGDEIIL